MYILRMYLLVFGIVALSSAVYAQTWVPCPQDHDFVWKRDADEPGWWKGTLADPESYHWGSMTQITHPPLKVRPKITQTRADVRSGYRKTSLFCTYGGPNTVTIFTDLDVTALGYSRCDPATRNHDGIWGSLCYRH